MIPSLEAFLTWPEFFGLETASPLQRAICRVVGGEPIGDLWSQDVADAMGDVRELAGKPKEVVLCSGIRTAKSTFSACAAAYMTQTCDVSRLRPGEIPRVSLVSLTKDLGAVAYSHLRSGLMHSAVLRKLIIGEPTQESFLVRHPSGRPIEIKCVAGARAGASLEARWSAGVIFDEAPKMQGADDAVVNLDHARSALQGRMLPGAQILYPGSPWAPFGPVYEMVRAYWRLPTRDLVVVKAPGWIMAPLVWTPERCEELRLRDPDGYVTNVLAEFRATDSGLFGAELDGCIRETCDELPDAQLSYAAAIDPATRGNSWTLLVSTLDRGVRRVVLARQWTGSRTAPLRPTDVFCEMAALLAPYRITGVYSDGYGADFLQASAERSGLYVYQTTLSDRERTERWLRIQGELLARRISLPNESVLISDLRSLTKRTTQNGLSIHLPLTSDGRHADYASALVQVLSIHLDDRKSAKLDELDREIQLMEAHRVAEERAARERKARRFRAA